MDGVEVLLDLIRQQGFAAGNFLGLLHVLIGRKVAKADGTPVSPGLTWRAVADLLKRLRWDKDAVREVGLDPDSLPPRDRQRYWYSAIALARVDSAGAVAAGDRLAALLAPLGYAVSPAPGQAP